MTRGNHGDWIALGQGNPLCLCVCVIAVDAPSCSAELLNKLVVKPQSTWFLSFDINYFEPLS